MKRSSSAPAIPFPRHPFPYEKADGISLSQLHSSRPYWTRDALAEATAGDWIVEAPACWKAGEPVWGIGQFYPEALLCCFANGFTREQARRLAPEAAGILCENAEDFLDFGLPVLEVPDLERALLDLGGYARDRFKGKVIAITGSAGKTGTTHLVSEALARYGEVDHSRASGNMVRAVGRNLASLSPDLAFWVLEMAFGNLQLSSPLVRPDVAMVISIHETHLHVCETVRRVAELKSLIFSGMKEGAFAVLNRDMREYEVIEKAAGERKLTLWRYGRHKDAEIRLLEYAGGRATVRLLRRTLSFPCALSEHMLANALGTLACVHALGLAPEPCLEALSRHRELPGRGRRHTVVLGEKKFELLDDSYNANPGSMRSGLETLRGSTPDPASRVALLGDCAELGEDEVQLHLDLVDPIRRAGLDRLLLCGPLMRNVWEALKDEIPGAWFAGSRELQQNLDAWLRDGDTVLVKSSGHKLTSVVSFLLKRNALGAGGAPPAPEAAAVLACGGEVTLGRRLHRIALQQGYARSLQDVGLLRRADFSLVCLGSLIAAGGACVRNKGGNAPRFNRARPEQLEILLSAGVRLAATANGHSGDYGQGALLEQIGHLDACGILQAGSGANLEEAAAPAYAAIGNYIAAVFSLDASTRRFAAGPQTSGTWYLSPHNADAWYREMIPRIALAREKAHLVLAVVYWGDINPSGPTPAAIGLAHSLIAAGADAVLGCSSRRLQGVEIYENRPIIYDLGTLLSPAALPNFPDAGLFTLSFSAQGVTEVRFHPLLLSQGVTEPATGKDALDRVERFSQKCSVLRTDIRREGGTAVISLSPPRHGAEPEPFKPEIRTPGTAPRPLRTARPEWTVFRVPASCAIKPVRLGPLLLHGFWVPSNCRTMGRRRNLWVESYWSLSSATDMDYQLYILATPAGKPPDMGFGFGMWHDPCDWMWPTSRWTPGVLHRDVFPLAPPSALPPLPADLVLTFSVLRQGRNLQTYAAPGRLRWEPEQEKPTPYAGYSNSRSKN
ncbi:MAG: CapA family protein [Desulfovibrio sp.]|jgi:UDP-N-acetylmuramyl pentapeptide synthase/poly-gamma-glutamate capsule biosynthesis protein CapA/YwtB (metallophosphatase superfamily)|nr:CapA family protein [Desulfovibrio sp.]